MYSKLNLSIFEKTAFVLPRLPLREPAGRASGYAAAPVRASRAAQPLTASSVSGVTVLS